MRKTRDTGSSLLRQGLPLLLSLALVACGSSDDNDDDSFSSSSSSSSSSSQPSGGIDNAGYTGGVSGAEWPEINVESTEPKRLHFSWTPVEGAEHYQLLKNPDGASGFSVVEGQDQLSETEASDRIAAHRHQWHQAEYMVAACMNADCSETEDSNIQVTTETMLDAIGYLKASNTDPEDWFGWRLALSADGRTLAVSATREASQATGVNGDADDNGVFGAGAVYVFRLSEAGLWTQEAYLKASNTESPGENDEGEDTTVYNDRFGYSLDLSDSGELLAVSAALEDSNGTGIGPAQDNNGASDSGAVYLFRRGDEGWQQEAFVKASNTEPPEEDEEEEETDEGNGDEEDEEENTIPTNVNDRFGHRVVLSGDGSTLAVSALYEASAATGINGDQSNNNAPNSGAVYVFTAGEQDWQQQAYIKPSNTFSLPDSDAYHLFGGALDISTDGHTLAVGAVGDIGSKPGVNTVATEDEVDEYPQVREAGAAYVFTREGGEWSEEAYIKPSHVYNDRRLAQNGITQRFGASVALTGDGERLAVGSLGDLSAEGGIDSRPDNYDLDDSGTVLPQSGAVHLFRKVDREWREVGYLKATYNRQGLQFGRTLTFSADGDHLAVAARDGSAETGIDGEGDDNSAPRSGAVYTYSLRDARWRPAHYIKSPNTETNDHFGQGLDLSADGATLAVGAHREDSEATGTNGERDNDEADEAGAVYLY